MRRYGFLFAGLGLIVLALLVFATEAILDQSVTYSEYGAVIIESSQEVSLSNPAIQKAGSIIPSAGTNPNSPVTLQSSNPIASNGVPKNNWFYRITIGANNTTQANQTFQVELYRWDNTAMDYNLVGTLYVKSDGNPAAGETARLYFNLGTSSPGSTEGFMITVKRYP